MQSIWLKSEQNMSFGPLKGDRYVDVLIIGGGIAGVLCAYMLEQAGVRYALVEAKQIGGGVTQNTTAKITAQHGLIYHTMLRRFGTERTKLYLEANQAALAEYRKLCEKIDCGFEAKPSYVYALHESQKLEREWEALQKIGFAPEYTNRVPLPFGVAGAVGFPNQAQFHPMQFLRQTAKDLQIYEQTMVRRLDGNIAITDYGKITAEKIIVTTHFPFLNRHGSYFMKLYQHRSYVIALEGAGDVNGMYVDEAEDGFSFRNYQNFLLLGGGSHRTGKQGGDWHVLREVARYYYPDSREGYHWATQDCMPLDDLPYIGQYSKNTPNLYVATGFHKWGMTSAMVAAKLLCDLVQDKENPYAEVFSPSRSILRTQLWINGAESIMNLLTPTPKRCPHMGCALKWNRQEHSWDCPCHGSRFTDDGELIENPAMRDL